MKTTTHTVLTYEAVEAIMRAKIEGMEEGGPSKRETTR
jgi:hypothetical protein